MPRRLAVWLALLLPVLAGGCAATSETAETRYPIGREAALSLPLPPGYPQETTLSQLVIGSHEGRRQAVRADVALAPDMVRLALSLPAGPRAMDILWTAEGIRVERADLVPEALDGPRILVDLFIARWPLADVAAALAPGTRIVENGTTRRILFAGETVAEYTREATQQGERTMIRNFDFGYDLRVETRNAQAG